MLEFKCKDCGKLLGYIDGIAEIKCPRCHALNRFENQREPPPKQSKNQSAKERQ